MKLVYIADRVATDLYKQSVNEEVPKSWVIRDAIDLATGYELSTTMLDRLCNMVERRLRKPYRYGLRN